MSRLTRAVATAAAALALVPAAAEARPSPAEALAKHLQRSEQALDKVADAVADRDARAARAALGQTRRHALAATRRARSLARAATQSDARAEQAIGALAAAADHEGETTQALAELIPNAPSSVQRSLSAALASAIGSRELLIDRLSGLLPRLNGDAQALAAQALTALQQAGLEQVASLAEVAQLTDLPTAVQRRLDSAVTSFAAALDDGLARVHAVLPSLSPAAQGAVNAALTTITAVTPSVLQAVEQATSGASTVVEQVLGTISGLSPVSAPSVPTTPTGSLPPSPVGGPLGGFLDDLLGGGR